MYANRHETNQQCSGADCSATRPNHTQKGNLLSDSEYALLGVRGAAKHWKIKGWVGSCGRVGNVRIWEMLLLEPDREEREVVWIKVPSHVTVDGNNEADRPASFSLHMQNNGVKYVAAKVSASTCRITM